jgi:TatD DNase family protein
MITLWAKSLLKNSSLVYINIHTHRKPLADSEYAIRNVFLHKHQYLPNVPYALSVGLHPWHTTLMTETEVADCLISICTSQQVLAIGEVGIDKGIEVPVHIQQRCVDVQLNVARALNKPLILHNVKADAELLPLIKKYKIAFLIHGFSGNVQQAKDFVKHGAYLSFGKRLWQDRGAEVFKNLPLSQCFFETDNATLSIVDVYTQAAKLKNIQVEDLIKAQIDTFAAVFKQRI